MFLYSIPVFGQSSGSQSASDTGFKLSLPSHLGQLQWYADGFKIIEASAKSKGQEIGLRGKDASGHLTFLGFLFLVPEQAPLSSAKCRDGALAEQKSNSTLRILAPSQTEGSENTPVALATYSAQGSNGKKSFIVRGFVATGDICGDLEFYSETPISAEDPDLRKIFESYRLDPGYIPQFKDVLLYAQILYKHQMYQPAAPIFEQALSKLDDSQAQQTWRRVTTDQAGMSYGMSGDIPKARALFEAAIAKDPDYPIYYYNLACADAEEKKLADARVYLQEAFARKGNVIPGEKMPDPTKDDSFLPYRNNKDFWKFLEGLH
jgi:tetratricopeptide (TPR) repeat protein